MLVLVFIFVVFVIIFVPFIPGMVELIRKKDADPLPIDLDQKINPFIDLLSKIKKIEHEVQVDQDNKEILYATERIIATNCNVKSLACEGEIILKGNVTVSEWVYATQNITAEPQCTFNRLYAKKIHTIGVPSPQSDTFSPIDIGQWGLYCNTKTFIIPPESHIKHDIYVEQNLHIRENVRIDGNIQTQGKVILSNNVILNGNLFAKGEIVIGQQCQLLGHVFSQKGVTIHSGTVIGEEGKIKSAIGKKWIKLQSNVTIFGHVYTKGEGQTV